MRTVLHFSAVLACLAAAIGSVYRAGVLQEPSQPLAVDGSSRHLGLVRQGMSSAATFKLRNASRQEIEILDLSTSCGCTAAVVGRKRLESGEATDLTATLHVGDARGRRLTQVEVRYRVGGGSTEHLLVLELTAEAEPHYRFRPDAIEFGPHDEELDVRLSTNFGPRVGILAASCAHPAIEVRVLPVSGTGPAETVRVRLLRAHWHSGDTHRPRVAIVTSSPLQPRHEFGVTVAPEGFRHSRVKEE